MSLQEKFQITVPAKEEAEEPWVPFESQRVTNMPPANLFTPLNKIPGSNIEDEVTTNMPLSMGGFTDVTNHLTPEAINKGFTKHAMKGTDDQYTGEHTDLFYGDAGGFVERNNYMDRE